MKSKKKRGTGNEGQNIHVGQNIHCSFKADINKIIEHNLRTDDGSVTKLIFMSDRHFDTMMLDKK